MTGSLPYLYVGVLSRLDGSVIEAELPLSWWPAYGQNTPVGRAFDHTGECPLSYAAVLLESNTRIQSEGKNFAVVEAVPQQILPHVALRLREMHPGG